MDAIEKRARELLAAEYTRAGFYGAADDASREQSSPHCEVTIRAIIAALTPPEGYLLVPAEPTAEMISAACRHGDGDEAPDPVYAWRAMLASRPEVP